MMDATSRFTMEVNHGAVTNGDLVKFSVAAHVVCHCFIMEHVLRFFIDTNVGDSILRPHFVDEDWHAVCHTSTRVSRERGRERCTTSMWTEPGWSTFVSRASVARPWTIREAKANGENATIRVVCNRSKAS